MTSGILIAFLTGYCLRGFRVWILLPIIALAIAGIILLQMMWGSGFGAALGNAVLIGIVLQLGYAFGLGARAVIAAMASRSLRKSVPRRSPLLDR